jgi:hypothetical protein
VDLGDSPERWADRVLRALSAPRAVTRSQALAAMDGTTFNIVNSVRDLENYYAQQAAGVPVPLAGPGAMLPGTTVIQ